MTAAAETAEIPPSRLTNAWPTEADSAASHRPDIGALVGAVSLWVFFWSVSDVFGITAGARPTTWTWRPGLGSWRSPFRCS